MACVKNSTMSCDSKKNLHIESNNCHSFSRDLPHICSSMYIIYLYIINSNIHVTYYIYIDMYTYAHLSYLYIRIYIYTYVYIYIRMYIYIHTVHLYIHSDQTWQRFLDPLGRRERREVTLGLSVLVFKSASWEKKS